MERHLVCATGSGPVVEPDRADLERRLAAGEFFWLDLHQPGPEDRALLHEVFGFHPLAVEDADHFGQRPKIDEYDEFALIVVYGAAPDEDRLVEVHCFYSRRYLVTVHQDDCPAFAQLRSRYARGQRVPDQAILVLHQVIDGLADSFFPVLDELGEALDAIEARLDAADRELQTDIFGLKRRVAGLRKAVGPQRELLARVTDGIADLPGLTDDTQRYFRDVYDHLIRVAEQLDGYRDLLGGATEVYLSTVSNRLNEVMRKLTVISTIFLPLTFITGFFGQNFPWLVDHIGGPAAFWLLGVGGVVAMVAATVAVFRRRGWI